jgi:hypothetical protein
MQVHDEGGRVVIRLDDVPDRATFRLLARQLGELDGPRAVVIDLADGLVLRPSLVTELGGLVAELADVDVWVSCPRLSGRRMVRNLLGPDIGIVRALDEAPHAPGASDPPVTSSPAGAPS